jgi:chemotaxis protein CheD
MTPVSGEELLPPPGRMPPALPQFSHINRYWDPALDSFVAKLLPGEYYVTERAEVICTVLGSCVSACIRDRVRGLGGMNHFMLPIDQSQGAGAWSQGVSAATRYGNIAMEMLINDLLKLGARRQHLEVKLVGGGRVLAATTDVGANNIDFVRQYVLTEGFEVSGEDLGGSFPRKVYYFPEAGKVRVKKLMKMNNTTIVDRERQYLQNLEAAPKSGGVELF